jgi:hypothetical protein
MGGEENGVQRKCMRSKASCGLGIHTTRHESKTEFTANGERVVMIVDIHEKGISIQIHYVTTSPNRLKTPAVHQEQNNILQLIIKPKPATTTQFLSLLLLVLIILLTLVIL